MMLVLTLLVRGGGAYEFTSKAELKAACDMWVTDQSTAQATYGHISTFGTGQITDMSWLFCGSTWHGDVSTAASQRSRTSTRTSAGGTRARSPI